jgi:NAD+-dependent secondary alcohol dehydrogenase Adh1
MVMRSTAMPLAAEPLVLDEIPTPRAVGPDDVVVRVEAAGVCRTDLHLATGEMAAPLPLVLGHENAGRVHEIGSAVTTVSVGDSVICFPFVSTGLSPAERAGLDTDAPDRRTPGITIDGGYAEYLLTNERSMLRVAPTADLALLAPLTDAGLAAYRACKRAAALQRPGDTVVVIGIGGLGHLAVQILRCLCPARIVGVDLNPAARALALECGADVALDPDQLAGVLPHGARAALDFVGLDHTSRLGLGVLEFGGTYFAVGVGGSLTASLADIVEHERRIEGVFVGTFTDLIEVTELTTSGRVVPRVVRYPLTEANTALHDLAAGRVLGRAVLEPHA